MELTKISEESWVQTTKVFRCRDEEQLYLEFKAYNFEETLKDPIIFLMESWVQGHT